MTDLHVQVGIALEILGLTDDAIDDKDAIESAFKRFARTVHPDINNGPEAERLMVLGGKCKDLLLRVTRRRRQPPPAPTSSAGWDPRVVVRWTFNGQHWEAGNG